MLKTKDPYHAHAGRWRAERWLGVLLWVGLILILLRIGAR